MGFEMSRVVTQRARPRARGVLAILQQVLYFVLRFEEIPRHT
jgi:hypothetical protein